MSDEIQYIELLQRIKDYGTRKGDRTGTGTISLFGAQMRFNLRRSFPLLTTKKLPFRWIAEELFWMLSGSTYEPDLRDEGVDIWAEWATPEQCARFGREAGDLGPVYGWQWRYFGAPYPGSIEQPEPRLREGLEPTYLGVANGSGKEGHPLKKRWEGMISRCYDPNSVSYRYYGGKGVSVCDKWLEFAAFAEDAEKLEGWDMDRLSDLELDKDGIGFGYRYEPAMCRWVTRSENCSSRDDRVFVLEKEGKHYRVDNVGRFCKEHGVSAKNMSDLWTGRKNAKERYGFRLVRVEKKGRGFDQLAEVVRLLIEKPNSRRIILSGWHPVEANQVALPPCHTLTQFYVADGELSAHMYQRSADVFLGVPFNIASYALLTHMLAHVTGLRVGDFVHSFGDVHIYLNHQEQVDEQLSRQPRDLPTLTIEDNARQANDPGWALEHLLSIRYPHLRLKGYNPHPKISAPVAV